MPDNRADPPEQPKTVQIPAADKAEIQFTELKVLIMTTFSALDAKVALGFRDQNAKLETLFSWKEDVDARLRNNSQRAQASSNVDLSLESRQAQLETAIVETRAMMQQQNDFLGIGKRGLQWIGSKDGRTVMAQAAAAIVFVYEGLKHSGVLK